MAAIPGSARNLTKTTVRLALSGESVETEAARWQSTLALFPPCRTNRHNSNVGLILNEGRTWNIGTAAAGLRRPSDRDAEKRWTNL
ncbi:MAG: hypothetical protein MK110_09215 [Fuerstiella sp.]|nr:hypothetical protein [Fuerstiella sp.]